MPLIGNGGHAKVIRTFWHSFEEWLIAVGDNKARKVEAETNYSYCWGTAIHPSAMVDRYVPIGHGTVIMAGVIVQPGCRIGKHVILNSGCVVDHDCIIEDYVHIAPGAHLCGNVRVGEGSLVGVSVGIAPNTVIPPWTLVKARRLELEPMESR